MAKYLEIEEEKHLPTLLFIDVNSGLENILLNLLVEKLQDKVTFYALTTKKLPAGVSRLSALSIHFLDHLSQDPSYAVLFLDEEKQKRKTYELIEKLSKGKTQILVLLPYRIFETFSDLILSCKDKQNVTFAFVGDLFGPHILHAPLSKVINKALLKKEVELSGNDLIPIFPISEQDVVSGIQHILFAVKNRVFVHVLFYDHPQTIVSLSHILKKLEPELSISFHEENTPFIEGNSADEKNKYLKQKIGVTPSAPSVSFIGFENSCAALQNTKLLSYTPSKRRLKIGSVKKLNFSVFQRLFAYMSFGFTLFIVASFAIFVLSIIEFRSGARSLASGNITSAKNSFETSQRMYVYVSGVVDFSLYVSEFFGQNDATRAIRMYSLFMTEQKNILPIIEKALEKNPQMSKEELQQMVSSIFNVVFMVQEFNNEALSLKVLENLDIPSRFLPVLSVAPQMLGYDGKKSYVILLQNNNELRPTGGFIGSVAYIEVENGKLLSVAIQDVYDLDGQLRGHIEPPFIIRRFLQPHLYLRDSNFSPDFQESASTSALLYNLETGKNIDGVIAIDTQVLKALVDIEGAISIPGYKDVLTSKNIVDVVQNSIQSNFFPGSTEKKRVLSAIFNHLLFDIENDKNKKFAFIHKLPGLLSEKHMLFSFAKPSLEKAVIASSFAGSLQDLRLEKNTIQDYLSVNEANIGVNKINAVVTRRIEYSALLKSSNLDSDLLVTFQNPGNEDYKTFFRALVPESVNLLKIFIDGQEQKIVPFITNPAIYEKKGFKPPADLEVNQEIKAGHKEIGFIVTVPKTSSVRVRMLYENLYAFSDPDLSYYSLYFVKQPGVENYPLAVTLQTDGTYTVEKEDNSPVLLDSKIFSDKEIKVKIVRTK